MTTSFHQDELPPAGLQARSPDSGNCPMRMNPEKATPGAAHYRKEAVRLRCQAEIARDVWIRRQLRDIAQRYECVAKTIEIIEKH